MLTKNIGKQIKFARKRIGLSQDALCKLSEIPLSTLTKIENAFIKQPALETIKKIADALKISIDDLLKLPTD